MTTTKTPIETLPYEKALKLADAALLPYLGRDIGDNTGWIFNGGVPYVSAKGKLVYNLTITPSRRLNEIEETILFHDTGIDDFTEFLAEIGIITIAHYEVNLDEASIGEKLRAL